MKRIALSPGDPAGIGPEICLRSLRENIDCLSNFELIGDINFYKKLSRDLNLNLSFQETVKKKNAILVKNIPLSSEVILGSPNIKNSKYNYQTFLAKDLNEKGLDRFEIEAIKPEKLFIKGLSLFLSKSDRLNVKIVNKDVVLFKAIDQKQNYSESAIIDRKSGELIHEVTKNIKNENSEKDISFYSCSKKEKKV